MNKMDPKLLFSSAGCVLSSKIVTCSENLTDLEGDFGVLGKDDSIPAEIGACGFKSETTVSND